ncbi:hypothetical protein [Pseudomonas sp. TMW22091]|uniref:hypothetical protein n=1 Tax=Pseudomonas sp. TMW22091 TaxID=2506435 RepID=UPI001F0F40DC|nr:hypothetical protein [Pseudomonas sp. TMW22091]
MSASYSEERHEAPYQANLTPEDRRRLLKAEQLEESKRQWIEQAKAAVNRL